MFLATLTVTVLPGVAAGALQAVGLVQSWLVSAGVAFALSMALAAAGSAWWARRPASRDIVFADLMLWGWLRRLRTERRLASARWLLGQAADLDPAHQIALLERLSDALEARDPYTHGHSRRVTRHAYRIARQMGLAPEQAARIRTAAAVHDVGKMETPREVLNKPGGLTDEEFAVIKRHPADGAAMVAPLGDDELAAIVRHHHERLDGGGYPGGLRGEQIPLGARVIAVADTFDALTSNRPYRPGCSHKKALDLLREEAGTRLDPDAVAAFLSYYSGRRALPLWSAVAAAPSRLASWLLGGVQGASAVPLGGGAAALGASLAVGASLAGAPVPNDVTRPVEAKAAPLLRAKAAPALAGARDAGGGSPADRPGSPRRSESQGPSSPDTRRLSMGAGDDPVPQGGGGSDFGSDAAPPPAAGDVPVSYRPYDGGGSGSPGSGGGAEVDGGQPGVDGPGRRETPSTGGSGSNGLVPGPGAGGGSGEGDGRRGPGGRRPDRPGRPDAPGRRDPPGRPDAPGRPGTPGRPDAPGNAGPALPDIASPPASAGPPAGVGPPAGAGPPGGAGSSDGAGPPGGGDPSAGAGPPAGAGAPDGAGPAGGVGSPDGAGPAGGVDSPDGAGPADGTGGGAPDGTGSPGGAGPPPGVL